MVRVLIMADEENIVEVLNDFLNGENNYEVFLAGNGHKALEIFETNPIDIVLMDSGISGLNGEACIEVFCRMKQLNPEIKVIILTDQSHGITFARALAVTEEVVEGFISKPVNSVELSKCLQIALAGNRHLTSYLTPSQFETIGKFATTATDAISKILSQITEKDMQMVLRNLNVIPLDQLANPLEEPELLSVSLTTQFSGAISGIVLFIVSWKGALTLLDLIKKVSPGTTKIFDDRGQAYLKSLGTILSNTYLEIFSKEVNLLTQADLPELVFKHRNDLIKSMPKGLASAGVTEEKYLFTIETELSIIEPPVSYWLSLIPTGTSQKLILRVLDKLE